MVNRSALPDPDKKPPQQQGRESPPNVSVFNYTENEYEAKNIANIEEWLAFKDKPGITWVNIEGLERLTVERLASTLNIHPLVVEDILDTNRRPKAETFDEHVYLNLRMIFTREGEEKVSSEQVNFILGRDFIITIQEGAKGDVFDPLRERIRTGKGRTRKLGPDYLLYAMVDAIVDNYYNVMEGISDQVEDLEDELMERPTHKTLQTLHQLKTGMLFLKKSVWPLREALDYLEHDESRFIREGTSVYFRDIFDHTIQLMDQIETHRDILSGMIDIYLSATSNKLNAIMKRLSLIMTIFMPLTLLSGIGGMSEWSMMTGPENWRIAYPLFLLGLGVIGVGTYLLFRWKKWN
jgi:magnesium transporter